MSKKEIFRVVVYTVLCCLINVSGRHFAQSFNLPLWLDSIGTVIMAYAFGPFAGALVGFTGNIIIGISGIIAYIYSITSVAIGMVVGLMARKGYLDEIFGVFSVSVVLTGVSVIVSVPVNFICYGGHNGNIWGDGVFDYLCKEGFPTFVSCVIGEFYVDFLDKLLTLMGLYVLIHLRRCLIRFGKMRQTMGVFLIVGIAAAALARPVFAGDDLDTFVQTVYNQDEGLSCGTANDIEQTGDGIIWIGTYAGLYRYNGTEFRLMQEFESVRNVNCLYVDEEGRLWIGTNDNGLSICINEEIANVLDESSGLVSNSVRSVTRSSDGKYYIGTSGAMQIVELKGGVKLRGTIPEIIYAHSLNSDAYGHVAAVTNDGMLHIIENEEVIYSLDTGHDQEIFTYCIFGDDGMLYAATSAGRIFRGTIDDSGVHFKGRSLMCETPDTINEIYYDDGRMYVCQDSGIGYFDAGMHYNAVPTQGFDNSVDSMLKDYQGNFWFVSSRHGLLRLTQATFTDCYRIAGMENHVANSVTEWQNSLYIGTDSGLDIIDLEQKKPLETTLTKELEGVRIRCVTVDPQDHLWLSTYSMGLIEVGPDGEVTYYNSGTDENYGDWARGSLTLHDGVQASASDTGICFIKDGRLTNRIEPGAQLGNAMVLCLLETDDGTLMAGTDGDGIAMIRDGKVEKRLTRENGLSSGVILRLVQSKRHGGIYIVASNGLSYMDKEGNIRSLSEFPYYNNYDLWQRSDGKLLIPGSAGIYVTEEDELLGGEKNLTCELLDATSGLDGSITANSWNYMTDDGKMFFSTDRGVYMLDVYHYQGSLNSYRMRVAAIELDGTYYRINPGDGISVPSSTDKIEIFPEIINYTTRDPIISYQLVGFDSKKIELEQSELTSVTYTNLPAGDYSFVLEVLDEDGKTLEQSTYRISREKEIYENYWFIAYMISVGMLAVAWFTWFVARNRLQQRLRRQEREIELARQQVEMGNETILAIARAVDAKDERTSQHSFRVSEYSVMIARRIGLEEEEVENLRKAALLHDIGKIGIPDRILNKPAKLTDDEYAIMKSHVDKGAEILKGLTFIDHLEDGVLYHHERYDGSGYTHGLKGEEIPLFGRIIGIADAFDAMTANRVYRKQLNFDYVLKELKEGRGIQFDPEILDVFLELINDGSVDIEGLYGGGTHGEDSE